MLKKTQKFVPVIALLVIWLAVSYAYQASGEIAAIKKSRNLQEQSKFYNELINRVGPEQAQEDLLRSGLPFTGETHLLNHVVGDYLYKKYGAAGLSYCRDYFLSSCYHGFVLNAIASGGTDEVVKIMENCRQQSAPTAAQCAHAVGHGFLAYGGYKNLLEALGLCDQMSGKVNNFPLWNCHDGVFMENIWGVHDGQPSPDRWIKSADPFYPCNDPRIAESYLKGCWSNQPALMYQMFNRDIQKVGLECEKVKNPDHQQTCFNGLARQIHPIAAGSAGKTFQMCELMPSARWVDYCVAVNAVAGFSVGDRVTPFELCAMAQGQTKDVCYNELLFMMGVYSKTPTEFCDKIKDNEWRQKCRQSA